MIQPNKPYDIHTMLGLELELAPSNSINCLISRVQIKLVFLDLWLAPSQKINKPRASSLT